MNTVETALVIILSVGFLTLLILSIILVSMMIAIMRNVKRISDKAESAVSNVAEAASTLGAKIAPVAVSTILAAVMRRFKKD